jgi:hypothetical protein
MAPMMTNGQMSAALKPLDGAAEPVGVGVAAVRDAGTGLAAPEDAGGFAVAEGWAVAVAGALGETLARCVMVTLRTGETPAIAAPLLRPQAAANATKTIAARRSRLLIKCRMLHPSACSSAEYPPGNDIAMSICPH